MYLCHFFAEESIALVRPLEDIRTAKIPDTVTFELELSMAGINVEWHKNDRPIRKGDKDLMLEAIQLTSRTGPHRPLSSLKVSLCRHVS